jgi:hypothetical protein
MIIPTPQYDAMFADDGVPFRAKMIEYIKREFSDLLGPHAGLLDTDQGLTVLSNMYTNPATSAPRRSKAA